MASWVARLLVALVSVPVLARGAEQCADDACTPKDVDDPALMQQAKHQGKPGPFKIAPCFGTNCPKDSCSFVGFWPCEAAGWVFCQNAVCEEPIESPITGRLISKCKCWQPSNTNSSMLPMETNSGANCVMNTGAGGETMCDGIKRGELWSTFGPTGDYLPGKPLELAVCAPHTLWAWCWGAKCHKTSNGHIICDCPVMKSTNKANQDLSLAGPLQCQQPDPCTTGIKNSMPAGSSPSAMLGSTPCYNYSAHPKHSNIITNNLPVP